MLRLMKGGEKKSILKYAGCLGLVHWDDPEGWYGEGGGRRVQDGEHMRNKGKKNKNKNKIFSCETWIFICTTFKLDLNLRSHTKH